ncbi:hypothetical protein EQG49_05165 [Periweissella cryptocerci]|uniref:Uncharacterized protein n=1 Tax=Periweissella cryptocerci TaxID=2506420 RepID=A0A4P6YT15_9LACO|nr:hypothetical protein [Periweissella cryptocerci]QBO35889.1 hypothetical protein EQG49_05165 [Periweissella cryptocerci]
MKIKWLISVFGILLALIVWQTGSTAEITSKNTFQLQDTSKVVSQLRQSAQISSTLPNSGGEAEQQAAPIVGAEQTPAASGNAVDIVRRRPKTWITKYEDLIVWFSSVGGRFNLRATGDNQGMRSSCGLWWIFWFTFSGILIIFGLFFLLLLLFKRRKRKGTNDEQVD